MIILAVPLLFVDITTDIYLYFISGLITSMMLCFKFTGLLKSIPESVRNIISIFIFIAVPVVNTIFVAPASNRNYVVMNLFIISIVCFILFLIIRNSAVTSVITTLLCFSLYTLNDVLIAIRGNILTLSDFSAFRTALTVASNYSYEITENVYYSFLTIVLLIFLVQIGFSAILNISKTISYQTKIVQIKKIRDDAEKKNKKLKLEIKDFSKTQSLEAIARNNLKMAGEDEVLILINDSDNTVQEQSQLKKKKKGMFGNDR